MMLMMYCNVTVIHSIWNVDILGMLRGCQCVLGKEIVQLGLSFTGRGLTNQQWLTYHIHLCARQTGQGLIAGVYERAQGADALGVKLGYFVHCHRDEL